MSEHPHHESLRLQNFTAFADASFEFVPGINVFIGENGTGKTHAMKAMYAWQLIQRGDVDNPSAIQEIYQADDYYWFLRDANAIVGNAMLDGRYGGLDWRMIPEQLAVVRIGPSGPMPALPVFIPALDMMGHTKGFVQTYRRYEIDFDFTHAEIVDLMLSPALRELSESASVLGLGLESVIGGKLELDGDRFYLNTGGRRLPMPMVAEGLRKAGTLLRLIQCGFLEPGATLFWDEPEVNLNPFLMDEVVSALLALSRNGVQIFLATHSYVILKELDLQSQAGEVRYFTFKPSEEGTTVSHDSDFGALEPNTILDQYDKMLIESMKKTDREAGASGPR